MPGQTAPVSLIIPTHNRADLLSATLESVWAQTCAPSEVLVVDDGSTDATPQVLAEWQAQFAGRLRVLRQAQAGVSVARNTGLRAAQGEFVALLDSDDLWEAETLAVLLNALQRTPHADFAYANYATFDERGWVRVGGLHPRQKINGSVLAETLRGQFICTGSFLLRRSALQHCAPFERRFPLAQDWAWWLQAAPHLQGVYVDRVLLRVRQHGGNQSRRFALMTRCNLAILRQFERTHPQAVRAHRRIFWRTLSRNYGYQSYIDRHAGQWGRASWRKLLNVGYALLSRLVF